MTMIPLSPLAATGAPSAWPALCEGLEEVCAEGPRDMASALVFALARLPQDDRPVLAAMTTHWLHEQGKPYGPGLSAGLAGAALGAGALILVSGKTEAEMLWAMEQALRSGAVRGVLGGVEGATLAQSRRLSFAADEGEAYAVLLRRTSGGLNAARRRWKITTLASEGGRYDPRAPGRFRLQAELTRSRSERPGVFRLEQDDETHRLRLADRLAGDGLGEHGRTGLAA